MESGQPQEEVPPDPNAGKPPEGEPPASKVDTPSGRDLLQNLRRRRELGPSSEALAGRELLQNFRRRRELGLIPGSDAASSSSASGFPGPAGALSAERAEALLAHSAYGYGQCSRTEAASAGADAVPGRCRGGSGGGADSRGEVEDEEAEAGEGGASLAGLEARRVALDAQVAEVEGELVACRDGAAELGQSVEERQQEMGRTVDEHAALSRALAEAQARHGEVTRESERLQAAAALVRSRAATARGDDQEEREEDSKLEALARARSQETATKKLALHRAQLVRLEEENRELRQRCEACSEGGK